MQPVPGEVGLCHCQDFKCNSRCLSSALESLSITWSHRLKVCPHTDPSQATGFFNKGIKDGFCRLPGKLTAPVSGRSRRERIPAGNRSPCPASSAARLEGAPAGTPPLPVPGMCKFQGTEPRVQTPPRVFKASSKQVNKQEPNSAHLF